MDKIEHIKNMVHEEVMKHPASEQWEYHFIPVHKWSLKLTEKLNANKETVELAAWLHDYTRVRDGVENHQITGAKEAKKILTEIGYPENVANHVHDCILTHQARAGETLESTEAKIIASADSMAHLEAIPWLITVWYRKTQNTKESIEWVLDKIKRGWERKICIPEAKEMIKNEYEAARLILESAKELSD